MHREEFTEPQYTADPQAPYSIYVFNQPGNRYDPREVRVFDTAKGVARWLESDEAIRIINVHQDEVRVVDSGDFLCFHAKGGVVLYPPLDPLEDMAVDADPSVNWTKIPLAAFALRLGLEDDLIAARATIDQVPAIFEAANFAPFEFKWLDDEKNVVLIRSTPKLEAFFESVSSLLAAGFPLERTIAAVYKQMGITPYPEGSPASRVFNLEKFATEAKNAIVGAQVAGRKGMTLVCICKDPHCPVRLAQSQREFRENRMNN